LDFPEHVTEYDMRKIIYMGLSSTLVALLASADVLAAKGATPVYGASYSSHRACNVTGDQATVSECLEGRGLERQKSTAAAAAKSRSRATTRVYLDDYQRLPEAVNKRYRTTPLVLGQDKGSE
jgi:hypothetical protein